MSATAREKGNYDLCCGRTTVDSQSTMCLLLTHARKWKATSKIHSKGEYKAVQYNAAHNRYCPAVIRVMEMSKETEKYKGKALRYLRQQPSQHSSLEFVEVRNARAALPTS
jgi:hypothetical protein